MPRWPSASGTSATCRSTCPPVRDSTGISASRTPTTWSATPPFPRRTCCRRTMEPKITDYNVPLMRDGKVVERPADQTTITRRYTDEAIAFIRQQQKQPFFLYLAHNLPHVPLFRSKEFEGTQRARHLRRRDRRDRPQRRQDSRHAPGAETRSTDARRVPERQRTVDAVSRAGRVRGPAPWREGQHVGRRHARARDLLAARRGAAGRDDGHWVGARSAPDVRHAGECSRARWPHDRRAGSVGDPDEGRREPARDGLLLQRCHAHRRAASRVQAASGRRRRQRCERRSRDSGAREPGVGALQPRRRPVRKIQSRRQAP